tara:strand:- start:275 stop:406 length:132 start_codon:yes stop_codon:yes gene_type:complete
VNLPGIFAILELFPLCGSPLSSSGEKFFCEKVPLFKAFPFIKE